MKKYSQLQQIISILITFVFLIEITGCSTTRAVQTSEFKASDKYIIHTQKTTYPVDSTEISEGILTCKLDLIKNSNNGANKTHIYLSSDSAINLNNGVLSVPVACITKIEQKVSDPKKTKWLVASIAITIGVGLTIGLIVATVALFDTVIIEPQETGSTGMCTNW